MGPPIATNVNSMLHCLIIFFLGSFSATSSLVPTIVAAKLPMNNAKAVGNKLVYLKLPSHLS